MKKAPGAWSRPAAKQPFRSAQDLAARASLDRHDLAVLAEAAALRGLAGHRHRARWEIAAVEKPVNDLLKPAAKSEPDPFYSIRPPSEVDNTQADYASTGLTLGRHPLALLRPVLKHAEGDHCQRASQQSPRQPGARLRPDHDAAAADDRQRHHFPDAGG